MLEGKIKEANNLINDYMLGYWSESYLPLGVLHIDVGHSSDQRSMRQRRMLFNDPPYEYGNYRRTLLLDNAVERIEYDQDGKHYVREMFVSRPDNVLAVRLSVSGGKMDFAMSLDSPLRHSARILSDGVSLTGRAADRVEPYEPHFSPIVAYLPDEESDALRMAAVARVVETDGEIVPDDFRIYVRDATYAVILLAADTNYAGFQITRDKDSAKVEDRVLSTIKSAIRKGYASLLVSHIDDYQALYGRVSVRLGESISDSLPTSERMAIQKSVDDPSLYALVIQYVRYLLISSSRPGTQAANLQGIWNPRLLPSWASNYTTNINVQMNYWAAEVLALPECHLPMMDLVRELSHTGRDAARDMYGMRGWVAHHNTDLWRMATVAGEDASWAWWPFGGFWMCQHLWQHYEYTNDLDFLRSVYPVLRDAAAFLCDFVVKDESGYYVTPPSTSPENKFFIDGSTIRDVLQSVNARNRLSANRGDVSAICKAATLDLVLIREIFQNCQSAAALLREELPQQERMDEVLTNLHPFKIGRYGQLQEWEDDYEECTPGMSHMSHLYTVYPSTVINRSDTPTLFEAAHQSIMRRLQHGSLESGWPGAWMVCLQARFHDPAQCHLANHILPDRLGANLLQRDFLQIDVAHGWAAGLAEMLMQSHDGAIELLPAMPQSWRDGKISGFRARGGYEVDVEWKNARLIWARILSITGGDCVVRYKGQEAHVSLVPGEIAEMDEAFFIQ